MLFQEEAKSELVLNKLVLFAVLPALILMLASIMAVEGFHPNAIADVSSIVILLAYYLPARLLLRRGEYYRAMKFWSVSVDVLVVSLTLVSYSYASGWIHSARTIVCAGYLVVVAMAGLYHDPKLPVFAAAMSILQYLCVVAYAVLAGKVGVSPVETFLEPKYSYDVLAFFVFCLAAVGAITAYGCSRFRSNLARSLSSEAYSRALAELDEQKTFFFSNVSHELRTPLTLILSPLESMLGGKLDYMPERHRAYLSVIHQNALRLLKLINNLLDFNKIEAGRMSLARQKTDLSETVAHYLAAARPAADSKGIALELAVEGSGPHVASLDRGLFEKAFFNLLSNALKFTPEGGRVLATLRSGGGRFELSVSDTGIGIPPDKLEFVFERFSQVDSTLSRRYEGTGIGLSLTREIVELHGGSVVARSEVGKGSTFTISMPTGDFDPSSPIEALKAPMPSLLSDIAPPPQAPTPAPREAAARGKAPEPRGGPAPKVLVVDDNPDLRDYLASFLGGEFEVHTAADGNEGLASARSARPDIVVSDVMMPGMDGYALCSAIKADPALSNVPVILLTARAEQSMKLAGYEVGADDYLGKPFNAEELLAKLRVFLGKEELRRRIDDLAGELRVANLLLEDRVRERTEELERQFYQILDSLANALEEKDPYTQGHSLRVERYAMMIADELGLSLEDKLRLSLAARLHDIGKIGIPERILNKEGALDDEELAVIKTHPERGARILSPLSGIDPLIVEAAKNHHERYDGKGYFGRAHEDIPRLARILAVADAFDAMTTTRAYRPAMGLAEALEEIRLGSGGQFDPESALAFVAAFRR